LQRNTGFLHYKRFSYAARSAEGVTGQLVSGGRRVATQGLTTSRAHRRLGTACEISIPLRVLSLTGYVVWLAYGVVIGDVPMIVVDLAGLAGAALVLHITLTLRSVRACPVV
jgi:hypothetical protein